VKLISYILSNAEVKIGWICTSCMLGFNFLKMEAVSPPSCCSVSRYFPSSKAYEMTVLYLYPSPQLLNQVTDLNEIWYERYAIRDHPSLLDSISYVL
jgi:hypothetical protein